MRKFAKAYHDVMFNVHLSPSEKWVLTYLGDAQGKNDASWHKQQTIADKLGITRRTVNNAIQRLEAMRYISLERKRDGIFYSVNDEKNIPIFHEENISQCEKISLPSEKNFLIHNIEELDQVELDLPYLSDLPKTAVEKPTSPPPPVSPKNPQPPKTAPDWTGKQTEQAKLAQQQADFAELWAAYPRGRGEIGSKKVALEKYTRALKKASHETIMQGIQRYKNYLETVDRPPNAAHVATWLFQERWECEYETATPQAEETPAERGIRLRAEFALKKQQQSA